MTKSYIHHLINLITIKFQVPRIELKIENGRHSSYIYNIDKPHNPLIVLSRDNGMNYITVIHEMAHHLTFEFYGNTYHGFIHIWFINKIREYLFWEELI